MSAEVERYFERQKKNTADNLYTCTIAEIIKVELKYMRADIKLLTGDENMIMQVPIAPQQTGEFIIRIPYKVGDNVVVMFAQSDIAPFLFGGGASSEGQHTIDDAIIVGGIRSFNELLLDEFAEYEEDFVIAKRDFSARIIIKENSEILIESDENINITSKKDINISAPNGIVTTTDSRGGS